MKQAVNMEVAALQPGMEVATAVADDGGRVLLPVGAILSAGAIASLVRREIAAVAVVAETPEDPQVAAAQKARVTASLDHVFRRAGDGAATRELYAIILAHRLQGQP